MRTSIPRHAAALAAALGLLCACTPSRPSTAFPASSIWAQIQATQDGAGMVMARIRLRDGPTSSAGYIYLAGGDTLLVSLDRPPHQFLAFRGDVFGGVQDLTDHVRVLAHHDLFEDLDLFVETLLGIPQYDTRFGPVPGAPPQVFLELDRGGASPVGESSAGLPPGFSVAAPADGATLSRAAPLALAWSPADADSAMEVDVAVDCGPGLRSSVHLVLGPDGGSATVPPAAYFPWSGSVPASATCSAVVLLQRVRTGGVSPDFGGGSFRAVQQRSARFRLAP
jgi:hypothetical protein